MKYTTLGNSDLKVSRICMGCMGLGDPDMGMNKWAVAEDGAREIIRYGLEHGINFFDTAMSYQNGSSEQILGRTLRDFAARDDYVVATKFLPRSQEELDCHISGQQHVAARIGFQSRHLNPHGYCPLDAVDHKCLVLLHFQHSDDTVTRPEQIILLHQ